MQRLVRQLVVLLFAVAATASATVFERPPAAAASEDTCWATGDIDSNGVAAEISDAIFLANFIMGIGDPPNPLYEGDLNADGYIDQDDLMMMISIITGELIVEWPLATGCHPDTIRGACWADDSCTIHSPENCAARNGVYLGDGVTCEDSCWVSGDPNRNDVHTEVADYVYLGRFIEGTGPPPDPLYEGDLNADGFIDFGDLEILWSIIQGELIIEWPVLAGCDPDTIRGACRLDDSCSIRSAENCAVLGGTYSGEGTNCMCDCTGYCDLNLDGRINLVDVVQIVCYVYRNVDLRKQILHCPKENGDWNCDDQVNSEDVVSYINYLYKNWGAAPCAPCAF